MENGIIYLFKHINGSSQIKFSKNNTGKGNYLYWLESPNSTINVYFFLKNGRYLDYFLRGNFSFFLPTNFTQILNDLIINQKRM